jgi:molybdopterin synthase catalytic subunit
MFNITERPLDRIELVDDVATPAAGAVVTFEGRVRNKNNDRSVTALSYTAYPELAEHVATNIQREAKEKFSIQKVTILQRCGKLVVGECSIRVAVSAAHRKAAFRAGEWIIDEIKKRLPVWKKEHYADGSDAWINRPEPSENDGGTGTSSGDGGH